MHNIDYTPYVIAVYALALVLYGGATWFWRRQLRRAEAHLEQMEKGAQSGSDTDAPMGAESGESS